MEPATPAPSPAAAPPPRRRGSYQRSVWGAFGMILATLLVVAGLAAVGCFVLAVVAMASFGSNK